MLVLIGLISTQALAQSPSSIKDSALAYGQAPVSVDGLSAYKDLANTNTEIATLTSRALAKFGANDLYGLVAKLQNCTDGLPTLGETRKSDPSLRLMILRNLDELAQNGSTPLSLAKAQTVYQGALDELHRAHYTAQFTGTTIAPDTDTILVAYTAPAETICLRKGMSSHYQAEVLVHELVHYVYTDSTREDPLDYRDVDDYAWRIVNRPGGEVDAFSFHFTQMLKVRSRCETCIRALVPFFDPQSGAVLNRDDLAHAILDQVGYRKSFYLNTYPAELLSAQAAAEELARAYTQWAKLRRGEAAQHPEPLRSVANASAKRLEDMASGSLIRAGKLKEKLATFRSGNAN